MKRYRVTTEWSVYSRGNAVYEVEAENEEDATVDYWDGIVSKNTVRDDTEDEVIEVVEIGE